MIRKIKATGKEGERMAQFLKSDSNLPPYMAYPRFLLDVDISETAKLVYMLLLDRAAVFGRATQILGGA